MPLYRYKCKSCDHEFSEMLKMDDRKIPVESPCPECSVTGEVYQVIGAPLISSGGGVENHRKSLNSDFKYTMSQIKKGHPGSTIPDY